MGNMLHRGHMMYVRKGVFYYSDTSQPVADNKDRPCGNCGKANTELGHDACLGTLGGPIINACCGHGDDKSAYIQYTNGSIIRGHAAKELF